MNSELFVPYFAVWSNHRKKATKLDDKLRLSEKPQEVLEYVKTKYESLQSPEFIRLVTAKQFRINQFTKYRRKQKFKTDFLRKFKEKLGIKNSRKTIIILSGFCGVNLSGLNIKGGKSSGMKFWSLWLKKNFNNTFVLPEKYTTQTHANCGKVSLTTQFEIEVDSQTRRNKGKYEHKFGKVTWKIHGIRRCNDCNVWVQRDKNAALNQMALFLATWKIYKDLQKN
jgi:hypothetical protein